MKLNKPSSYRKLVLDQSEAEHNCNNRQSSHAQGEKSEKKKNNPRNKKQWVGRFSSGCFTVRQL